MKKLLLLIILIVICDSRDINAQNIVNGDFSINSGNDGVSCGTFGTFSDNSVPNWVRSHGTPNFQVINNRPNNHMFLWTNGTGTEGILGNYSFKKTKSYCVKINLDSWSTEYSGDEFKVYACTNLVRNLTLNNSCVSNMPVLPANAELIGTGTKQSSNTFTFNPINDNNQIFIVYSRGGGTYNFIVISEVIVNSYCKESLIFDNGPIPVDSYMGGNIYAGTSAGSGSVIVTNNPIMQTTLTGYGAVFLLPSFDVSAIGTGFFIANIGPCTPNQCNAAKNPMITPDNELNKDAKDVDIHIYPNPTNDFINIEFVNPYLDHYTYTILNLSGHLQKIITKKYEDPSISVIKEKIDISSFAPGTYFLRVMSGTFNKFVRFIVIR